MKNKGVQFILLSAFFFAVMNLFVKLSGDLPSVQKSFFRNLVAAGVAAVILIRSHQGFGFQKKESAAADPAFDAWYDWHSVQFLRG